MQQSPKVDTCLIFYINIGKQQLEKQNNGVKVTIYKREYNLKANSKEDEYFLRQIAAYVDEKAKGIASSVHDKNFEQIFVLTSLNLTAELFSLKNKQIKAKKRLKDLLDKLSKEH